MFAYSDLRAIKFLLCARRFMMSDLAEVFILLFFWLPGKRIYFLLCLMLTLLFCNNLFFCLPIFINRGLNRVVKGLRGLKTNSLTYSV